jgi:SAM-dependent methyltransferase
MSSLVEQARRFSVALDESRNRAPSVGFEWYPYQTISNVQHLEALLGAGHGYVMEAAREEGILDLGCGDGDLAFFFEWLGYKVTCVDYPPSNHNDMQGLKALQRELHSTVTIREIDVDSEFPLDGKYGLTLCLGLLYHLKNPFFVLEHVARVSRLQRSRWEVVQLFTTGDRAASDPASLDHDERAFCLLRSHYGCRHLDLLEGWHHVEDTGWRWTKRQFAARATSQLGMRHSRITMRLFAPPFMIEKFGGLTLHAKIDGAEVQPLVMRDPGVHVFVRKIPKPSEVTLAVFHVDKVVGPDAEYSRELGIIVASLEFT